MKIKYFSILIILSIFCSFAIFDKYNKSKVKVLRILNASTVQVDLNRNGKIDIGETICVPNIKTLTSDLSQNQSKLTKELNLSFVDGIKFGYLSDEFAENQLSQKLVKIKRTKNKTPDCNYSDIIINNQSYRNNLINSGFGISETYSNNEKFKEQLAKAQKLNLVILNHRSGKYHTLDCEYGLAARDSVIIPARQLESSATPCKYCHIENKNKQNTPKQSYPLIRSKGEIKMFLTDSTTTLKPDSDCNSLICKEVLNQIDSAKQTIDIALYGWDSVPKIYNALKRAKMRNVKIRIVYDISENNYYPDTVEIIKLADVATHDDKKGLMHNKFIIFDNEKLITGSMNFSKTGLSGFNSNCIFLIKSKELSQIYENEFNQMINGKFKNLKEKQSPKTIIINKSKITALFSPQDKITTNLIIKLINSAENYIYIPAFIITHKSISDSLIDAKSRGVDVKIITDATNVNSSKSKIKTLRNAGVNVKTENYAGKLHSKSIIIDDKFIISGSMNFTNSGENKNDENSLIIEDYELAKFYRGFFEYYWKKIPDKYLKQNPSAEGKSSIGSCSDGIDNDYDGKADKLDNACT